MEIRRTETIAFQYDEDCNTPHRIIYPDKKWVALDDIINELKLLSNKRLTDKKRHDVVHWLHIRELITRLNEKE